MRRIALEEHFVIDRPDHLDRWKSLIPGVPASVTDPLQRALTDIGDGRVEAMAQAGIDVAILSSVASVQGELDAAAATRIARESNDFLAETVRADPAHFAGFAAVPLQADDAGVAELTRAVDELGLRGVMVFGQTNGEYLDADRLEPFWEAVESLGIPVYLHAADPVTMPVTYAGRPELIGATWSWTAETAAHTLRLIYGGVFTRHPRAQLVLGHMGETLPYLIWRENARAAAFDSGVAVRPGDLIVKNVAVTTAGMFSDPPLHCAIDALGAHSVIFSVDHPFESMTAARDWFDAAPLADDVREQVSAGNATRLFGL